MLKLKLPLSLGLVCCLLGFNLNAATVLKIATIAPDATTWMKEMRMGAAEIEQRTEGRVKLKFYPGGVMGSDATVLRKIRIGQLQGGAVTAGTLAEIYPDAQIYSLPMQFSSLEELNYVRKHMDSRIREGLERNGLVNVGISNGGFAYIAGSAPVAGIADLKKQRVWIPQGDVIGETMFKAAGISPVPLQVSDVYTALQTGLLDTVIANPSSIIAFQWHTKVKYLTDSPLVLLIGMMVLDKRAFARLTPGDQKIVSEVMTDKFRKLDELNQQDNENAKLVLQKNGIEFIKPTAAERQTWLNVANGSLDGLARKGAYTQEFLQLMQKHINAYRSQAQLE